MVTEKSSKSFKRLIVGCDGTWLNSDSNFEPSSTGSVRKPTIGRILKPSNITRICRAVKTTSKTSLQEIPQIAMYQPGIGSAGDWWDHWVNGATGFNLAENVREAYGFLCNNYEDGDEIIILGFSRGAFTARTLGALICQIGLLTYEGMEDFYSIFRDWEQQGLGQKFAFRDRTELDWLPRTDGLTSSYAQSLVNYKVTRPNIKVKAIACFDTVGALGVPILPWIQRLQQSTFLRYFIKQPPFSFVDQEVLPNVENCFQALALDEHRRPFSPTLWEVPEHLKNKVNLRQCWFPGTHSNVGGSFEDAEIANLTLAWMTSQLNGIVEFEETHLQFAQELNEAFYKKRNLNGPQWAMGNISESYKGFYTLDGSAPRTPLQYWQTNPVTGKNERRLRNTNEFIHPSVRVRQARHGTSYDCKGVYNPAALKDFKLVSLVDGGYSSIDPSPDPFQAGLGYVLWKGNQPVIEPSTKQPIVLPEETLRDFEPKLYHGVFD